MKKYLFCALAASMALAGCTDDYFGESVQKTPKGDMIKTSELNLVVSRGEEAQTRATWDSVKTENGPAMRFYWNSENDKIGMAYILSGTKAATNYGFTADSLKLDADSIQVKSSRSADKSVSMFYKIANSYSLSLGSGPLGNYELKNGSWPDKTVWGKERAAKFETENDYIMKGTYVVYYPYNAAWTEGGTQIPVKSPATITVTNDESNLEAVGEVTFSYSNPVSVESGAQVTEFALKNLSSVLQVRIANKANLSSDITLKSVVLRTHGDDRFVTGGVLNDATGTPAESKMTANETEKTSTLFVNLPKEGANMVKLAASKTETNRDSVDVFFPILPVTMKEGAIDVILIGTDNKACVIERDLKSSPYSFAAGRRIMLRTDLTENDKFDQAFVTNAEDLQSAVNAAKDQTSATTINLLGDIECENLSMSGTTADDWKGGVNIANGGSLTLTNPTINAYNCTYDDKNEKWDASSGLTINCPVTIKGGSVTGGVLTLNNTASIKGSFTLGSVTASSHYAGQLEIGGDVTLEKDATLTSTYSCLMGDRNGVHVKTGATLTVAGGATFVNCNWKTNSDVTYKSDLVVEGTLNVKGTMKDGGDTQINGGTLNIEGNYNNVNTLTGDAASTITVSGTLVNDTLGTTQKWMPASTGITTNWQGDGNIKNDGTMTVTGSITNKSSFSNGGAFENNGTYYDYLAGAYGGYAMSGTGTYACYVESQEQLGKGVIRLNNYAADQDKLLLLLASKDNDRTYQLGGSNLDLTGVDVATGEEAKEVRVKGSVTTGGKTTVYGVKSLATRGGKLVLAGSLDVPEGGSLTVGENTTVEIENNVTVRVYGKIVNNGTWYLLPTEDGQTVGTVYCKSWTNNGNYNTLPYIFPDGMF